MKEYGTQRSTVKPLEMEVTEEKIFIASNIIPVNESGIGEQQGFTGYEFELTEYEKDEYIKIQAEQNVEMSRLMGVMFGNNATELVAMQTSRFIQMSVQAANLTDDEAIQVADLYEEWKEKVKYPKDRILKYGVNDKGETQLYRVVVEHTSQTQYPPDTDITHYKKIGFDEGGTPIWSQPLGGHDAYKKGDVVTHNGKIWVSTVDNNVWEPGVYGWELKA